MKKMRPLQLWLPIWEVNPVGSPLARDIQQAFARWDNDDVVWLIPWIDEVVRWYDPTINQQDVAIPANSFNRIGVYHMGKNGYVWRTEASEYFPSGRIDETLLDLWLSIGETGVVPADALQEQTVLGEVPEISDGQFIRYREWGASNQPAFFLPNALTELLPLGGNLGQWAELEAMAKIAKRSAASLAQALRVATAYGGPYITEGISNVARAWLLPIKLQEGEGGVMDATQPLVPNVRSLAQAKDSPEWRDHVAKPVTIRRVWGIFGLFWALLLERLEASQPFSVCVHCKRLLPGRHKRTQCGPQDDKDCFKAQQAKRQARSRAHHKPKGTA
jgi:hypothetical protein